MKDLIIAFLEFMGYDNIRDLRVTIIGNNVLVSFDYAETAEEKDLHVSTLELIHFIWTLTKK